MAARACALLLLACTLALGGCITRFSKLQTFDSDGIRIYLRSEKRFGVVEKGYDHPATISAVRLTHILSRIDVRMRVEDGNRRVPAIATDQLYTLGEGLSAAFAKADPNQEVVVMAFEKKRHLGIFDSETLSSFLAYVRDGSLFIHLSRIDWPVPDQRALDLPEPRVGDHFEKFRIQSGEAMTVIDPQSVAVDWRDSVFARPTRTKVLPSGEVVRKTILFESPPDAIEEEEAPASFDVPAGITPDQLRALADLEEARRDGEVTEAEYRARRRDILAKP